MYAAVITQTVKSYLNNIFINKYQLTHPFPSIFISGMIFIFVHHRQVSKIELKYRRCFARSPIRRAQLASRNATTNSLYVLVNLYSNLRKEKFSKRIFNDQRGVPSSKF